MHRGVLLKEATKCALPWLTAWCLCYKYDSNLDNSQILHFLPQRGFDTALEWEEGMILQFVTTCLFYLGDFYHGGIHFPGSSYSWNSGFQGNRQLQWWMLLKMGMFIGALLLLPRGEQMQSTWYWPICWYDNWSPLHMVYTCLCFLFEVTGCFQRIAG